MGDIRVEGGIRLAGRDYYEGCTFGGCCAACPAQTRRNVFVSVWCWLAMLPFAYAAAGLITRNDTETALLTLALTALGGSAADMVLWAWRQRQGVR